MNVSSQLGRSGGEKLIWANAYERPEPAPLWEQGLVAVWFLVNMSEVVPMATPIRYLLVLFFLLRVAQFKDTIFPMLMKCLPLFLIPAFGMLSVLWAPWPPAAFKQGLLLFLTPVIIVTILARMNLDQALRAMLLAALVTVVMYLQFWGTYHLNQVYGSKNYLAMQMLIALILSLITVLDKVQPIWLRLIALPFIPLTFYIIIQSQSATNLVFAAVSVVGLVAIRLFWMDMGGVKYLRSLIILTGTGLFLCGLLFLASMPQNDILSSFLALLGKDTTLTGRTQIWAAGEIVANQHPVLGVGLDGFWQRNNGAAQSIIENDFKPYGIKLTFHNTYLETRVHLGYIGLALMIIQLTWCFWRSFLNWIKAARLQESAMLLATGIVLVSTVTESWVFSAMTSPVNILFLSALAGLSPHVRQYIGKVPVWTDGQTYRVAEQA